MRYLTPFLSFLLIPLLVSAPLSAQVSENPGASGNSPEPQDLQIRVIAGGTGSASVNSEASSGFTIEVTGSDGTPVVDAAVAVRLPDTEPTGVFADGSHATVSYTDQSGRARLAAVKWGGTPGVVAIRVTAVKGTAHAGVLAEEKLVPGSALSVATEGRAVEPMPIMTEPLPTAPAPIATAPQPSTVTKPGTVDSSVASTATHPLTPAVAPLKPQPSVSVTSSVPQDKPSHSHKKWIVIAAVAAGAGAGIAFAGRGKSSGSSSPAPSLSIGAPTVSVGHP